MVVRDRVEVREVGLSKGETMLVSTKRGRELGREFSSWRAPRFLAPQTHPLGTTLFIFVSF